MQSVEFGEVKPRQDLYSEQREPREIVSNRETLGLSTEFPEIGNSRQSGEVIWHACLIGRGMSTRTAMSCYSCSRNWLDHTWSPVCNVPNCRKDVIKLENN